MNEGVERMRRKRVWRFVRELKAPDSIEVRLLEARPQKHGKEGMKK